MRLRAAKRHWICYWSYTYASFNGIFTIFLIFFYGEEANQCYCGDRSMVWTSWTDNNPGRRFYGCPNYKANGSCGYFKWLDPPICIRGRRIIPRLLKRIEGYRARERIYWVILVISWVITIAVVMLYVCNKRNLRNERVLLLS